MKSIMEKSPHSSSFSFSRRYFHCKKKVEDEEDNDQEILTFSSSSSHFLTEDIKEEDQLNIIPPPKKKHSLVSVSKLRSALTVFGTRNRSHCNHSVLGRTKVIGTLFGYRRGHVHFSFQEDPKSNPRFLIELATPTSVLVREMASGLVRIALECERKDEKKKGLKLLDEPLWRTYCNGKKCGFAIRRECGNEEWKVLKAVEMITMGAGVLPGSYRIGSVGSEGEVMYMRAGFERVVGSKDSEAFYMMNPDCPGGPELSIYLLRG